MAAPQQAQQATPAQANAIARQLILERSVRMTQNIFSTTIDLDTQQIFQVAPRNVGLIEGFWVEIALNFDVDNQAGSPLLLSSAGLANLLSNVQFTDLNNNVRINTTGWHLHYLASAKNGWPFLAARGRNPATGTASYPVNMGAVDSKLIAAPDSINNVVGNTVYMLYWVPLAYSSNDLRGSVYANVVNATMNLQLTVNKNGFAPLDNTDLSGAVYQNPAAAAHTLAFNNVSINVYQVYWDQLPMGRNGPVLPVLDLATIYEIKNTVVSGVTPNADFPIPYANFRDFLSTFAIYANGAGTAGLDPNGDDVNYWSIQSANFTNIRKTDPHVLHADSRIAIRSDFPPGVNYFSTRSKPISTLQFGNMELILNAKAVNTGAKVLIGYEAFALVNSIVGASSLAVSG